MTPFLRRVMAQREAEYEQQMLAAKPASLPEDTYNRRQVVAALKSADGHSDATELLRSVKPRVGSGRKIPDDVREGVVARYTACPALSYTAIAREFRISDMTVKGILKTAGVKLVKRRTLPCQ